MDAHLIPPSKLNLQACTNPASLKNKAAAGCFSTNPSPPVSPTAEPSSLEWTWKTKETTSFLEIDRLANQLIIFDGDPKAEQAEPIMKKLEALNDKLINSPPLTNPALKKTQQALKEIQKEISTLVKEKETEATTRTVIHAKNRLDMIEKEKEKLDSFSPPTGEAVDKAEELHKELVEEEHALQKLITWSEDYPNGRLSSQKKQAWESHIVSKTIASKKESSDAKTLETWNRIDDIVTKAYALQNTTKNTTLTPLTNWAADGFQGDMMDDTSLASWETYVNNETAWDTLKSLQESAKQLLDTNPDHEHKELLEELIAHSPEKTPDLNNFAGWETFFESQQPPPNNLIP